MEGDKKDEAVDTVHKAAAYGDFDRLRELAAADPGALHAPDADGYRVLQWAALNNRAAILAWLLHDRRCDPAARDASGQTALHWACVRGAAAAADALLAAGAPAGAADGRGYTPAHVAAQYGQAAALHRLALRWGAPIDEPDADGRSPLHWAAYKGHADVARLLLVAGAAPAAPDREGCTPLHWAAIRGNAEAAAALLHGGGAAALGAPDATGATPAQLAVDKGHTALGVTLAEARRKRDAEGGGGGGGRAGRRRGLAAALARAHLAPVVWAIALGMLGLLWGGVLRARACRRRARAPRPRGGPPPASRPRGSTSSTAPRRDDPGFLPRNAAGAADLPARRAKGSAAGGGWADDDGGGGGGAGGGAGGAPPGSPAKPNAAPPGDAHDASLNSPALWAGAFSQLCVTCKSVRPLRAKHCAVTGRCVETFDHYCPWVGNAIGRRNRRPFLAFLALLAAATAVAGGAAVAVLRAASAAAPPVPGGALLLPVVFVSVDLFLMVSIAALGAAQAGQVARNVTTNEMANWHRYRYLHGGDGEFANPFDRGWRANCAEVWAWEAAPPPPAALGARGSGDRELDALLAAAGGAGGDGLV